MNQTFQVIGFLRSCLVSLILTPFSLTKWLNQQGPGSMVRENINKEIFANLCDKKVNVADSVSFNIIQQPRTMTQTKTFASLRQK